MARNMTKSRRKKSVIVELPDELKEPKEQTRFFNPFVLGMAVALVLMFVPTLSGVYWLCKDVPAVPPPSCPAVLKKKKAGGLFRIFKKKEKANEEFLLELPPPQDPITCACQLGWNALRRIFQSNEISGYASQQPSTTCIPKVIDVQSKSYPDDDASSSSRALPDPKLKERYTKAFTPEKLELSGDEKDLITKLAEQTRKRIPDWDERASKVRWGGTTTGPHWLDPIIQVDTEEATSTDLEALEGGTLYYSYLRIMQWPETLFSHFPIKLCAKGCDSVVAISHTLEFREKFQPWMVPPAVKAENSKGCMYFHGFSPSYQDDENGSHAVVWMRPGQRTKVEDMMYTRALINTLETAVAASLEHSHGRVGKFNVVVDGSGFSWSLTPSLHQIKTFVTILQDHFPDRLGIILLTNLGRVGEFVVKLFLPLITEEVRKKIIVLPHDEIERQQVLETVVGLENIPMWLDGTDSYQFNADDYYSNKELLTSDEKAKEYITTMPYHA